MALNAVYEIAKLFGDKLGRRVQAEHGDQLWIYPSSQGNKITVWIEPDQAGLRRGDEPSCVVLTPKQLGDFIAAARSQAALSQVQYEARCREAGQ